MLIRLIGLTGIGLLGVFATAGRDLSATEQANWDARHDNRVSLVTLVSAAFEPENKRQGGYVPTLAELQASETTLPSRVGEPVSEASVQLASLNVPPTTPTNRVTSVDNPEKLAALLIAAAAEQDAVLATQEEAPLLMQVTASRVNVRSGPSTANDVLGQVVNAEIVQVLTEPQNGWVKISVQGAGVEGYTAAKFLTSYE